MSDYSQSVYDAVRSKFYGDFAGIFERACSSGLDFSFQAGQVKQAFEQVAYEMIRPCVVHKPTLAKDGNAWIALLGDDLQVGVVGCGKTPAEAFFDFDREFYGYPKKETP